MHNKVMNTLRWQEQELKPPISYIHRNQKLWIALSLTPFPTLPSPSQVLPCLPYPALHRKSHLCRTQQFSLFSDLYSGTSEFFPKIRPCPVQLYSTKVFCKHIHRNKWQLGDIIRTLYAIAAKKKYAEHWFFWVKEKKATFMLRRGDPCV